MGEHKTEKPKVGKLLYNGKVIVENKPFPFLQQEKRRYLASGMGHKKELFKITY